MKRALYILSFFTILLITAISCTKEEETPEPTINFKTGEYTPEIDYHSVDTSLVVNTDFTFGILAESNSTKNITSIKVFRKLEGGTPVKVIDLTNSSQSVDLNWTLKTSTIENVYETFSVEVSDANNMTNSVSLTIYTLPSDPGIIVYGNRFLTSFELDFGHFFAISNGLTYDTADCIIPEVQELIDFGYFDHVTYGHTLMSPDEVFFQTIYPSVGSWSTKNTTRFSETEITPGAFDAIETIEQFTNALDNAVEEFDLQFVANNEEGLVLAFITKNQTRGLLKIISAESSANFGESTMSFDVKIEKNTK